MAVVLIIEDDADVADTVNACLESSGHTCHVASTGEQGLDGCKQLEPDVIILDLTLPGMDGIEVCTHIRRLPLRRDPYILMLTARGGQLDEITGLATGADDYMAKPFSPALLTTRVQTLLRRDLRRDENAVGAGEDWIRHQHVQIHTSHRHCSVRASSTTDWVELELTSQAFDVLAKLAQQPGRVYSRAQLFDDIWGVDHEGDERNTVDACIKRLRKELRTRLQVPEGRHPFIKTERGVGYKFEDSLD
jgi:two-component system alkaline phosphatase synthesis response regulator PhoP